jgi:hypothetical protein
VPPPPSDPDEQSEEERLAIARRYRVRRGEELRALAQPHAEREVIEAGEFSTMPIESLAAVPIVGALFAAAVRIARSRKRLTPNVLLALDSAELHLLALRSELEGTRAEPIASWSRDRVGVVSVAPRFMRERVVVEIEGEEPLTLYASSLRTNPWAAAVVRALGGDAPEPIDLGDGGDQQA